MSVAKMELDIGAGSCGKVLLDGVDISSGLTGVEYKAVGGKLAVMTLTYVADVQAKLEVDVENLTVEHEPKPGGGFDGLDGRVHH